MLRIHAGDLIGTAKADIRLYRDNKIFLCKLWERIRPPVGRVQSNKRAYLYMDVLVLLDPPLMLGTTIHSNLLQARGLFSPIDVCTVHTELLLMLGFSGVVIPV
jgi:hypothetical protein